MDSWMVLTAVNESDETGSGETGSEIYLFIIFYLMKKNSTKDTGSEIFFLFDEKTAKEKT